MFYWKKEQIFCGKKSPGERISGDFLFFNMFRSFSFLLNPRGSRDAAASPPKGLTGDTSCSTRWAKATAHPGCQLLEKKKHLKRKKKIRIIFGRKKKSLAKNK